MLVSTLARALSATTAVLALCCAPAFAGVYKCKDANGDVIYSNTPCDKQGAKQQKELSKSELQSNQMRMRPRPDQGNGAATFEGGQNSNYQGAAPDKKPQGPTPVPAGAVNPRQQDS